MHSAATDLKSLRLLLLPPPSRHSLLRKDKLRKIAQKLIRLLHSSDLGVVFTLLHFNTLLYYTTLLQEFTTRIYYTTLLPCEAKPSPSFSRVEERERALDRSLLLLDRSLLLHMHAHAHSVSRSRRAGRDGSGYACANACGGRSSMCPRAPSDKRLSASAQLRLCTRSKTHNLMLNPKP